MAITVDDFITIVLDDMVQKKFYEIFEHLINLTITKIYKKRRKNLKLK